MNIQDIISSISPAMNAMGYTNKIVKSTVQYVDVNINMIGDLFQLEFFLDQSAIFNSIPQLRSKDIIIHAVQSQLNKN